MSPSLYLPTYLLSRSSLVRKGKGKEKRGRDVPGGVENELKREI